MELNANEIIKALECCKTPLASDCENCSYTGKRLEDGVYEGCVNCLVGDALTLITSQEQRIKELTEENERLREKADRNLENLKAVLEERNENTIVADTVRKMRNKLVQYIGTYTDKSIVKVFAMFKLIDQIAEEIMGDAKQ